jgi:aminoglycoside phosphotransferase (APT) family kinase protein
MANVWDADVEITPDGMIRRIGRQFPELVPVRLEPLGVGWDNVAVLVNDGWVFRFPRRRVAAALIEREARVLPLLAPHLPLPIPVPRFRGAPGDDYPYPFSGYARLPGVTACRAALTDAARADLAVPLARFLAALHRVPVDDELRAGGEHGDDIGRTDLPARAVVAKERLHGVAPALAAAGIDAGPLPGLIDRLAAATPPHAGPACWVHGDLYARHLLVDAATRRPCGVIDWGDVHLGDPALDLSIAWSFLPPGAPRNAFRVEYGAIDRATWDRARFRALHYGPILVRYGIDTGDDAIREAGEFALRAAATY